MAAPTSSPPHQALGRSLGELSLGDVEAVRLLLRGGSVIDWHRLSFASYEDLDRFLRVNEFDPDDPDDVDRLEVLREEAVEYITRNFSFRIPPDVAEEMPARELLMLAAQKGRRQTHACIVLKVMHIIQHLAGRELLTKLPISDDAFFHIVEAKVVKVVEDIRAAGLPIVEFAWSRKERDSLITKLLAKKQTLAAHVYDKLRFRLITRTPDDLVPALAELTQRIIPFNYVVPGESVNDLVSIDAFSQAVAQFGHLAEMQPEAEGDAEPRPERAPTAEAKLTQPINEFSAADFKIVNFVADLPVRVDRVPGHEDNALYRELGRVVYVLTEFQVVDAQTAEANDRGDASHLAYKERQKSRVKARLTRGVHGLREGDTGARVAPGGNGKHENS